MIARKPILRIDDAGPRADEDDLVIEEPLEIRVRGRAVSVTMRTPGHDDELAVGFLLSEGIVRSPGDVLRVEPCGRNEHGNLVNVQLAPEVQVDFDRLTRHVFASSSCGLCGAATIESIRKVFPPIDSACSVSTATLFGLPTAMRAAQSAFDRTGAVHAAAVFDPDGQLVVLREDVGRHNAVDKVLGRMLLDGRVPLRRSVLLVSGRSSFEIVQKAQSAGVPIVASVSGPSGLAVELAETGGQTLIGFLRDRRMNIYAGAQRVRN